jgi:UDP-galactopyranose mutase
MIKKKILIVGAGISGAVIARELADAGYIVDIFEERNHVAGNCHTSKDVETDIMVHVHGPHIFHTNNENVWNYVNRFANFHPYICQVKATVRGRVFSLPINLLTINQFYSKKFNPSEAKDFIESKSKCVENIQSFEDQALCFVGPDLYDAFFKGYPLKQWGIHPRELPASILKRLPVRFNYDDNYFDHRYQGIPDEGYTEMVENILKYNNINVFLKRKFTKSDSKDYHHVFFSGTLDGWFDHKIGYLGYRTLRFEASRHLGDFQGCAVMSYPDEDIPFTRITEHKHFTPWKNFEKTIIFHEYSSYCQPNDTPYYPIRLVKEKKMLWDYVELAKREIGVTFIGRLGTYRYLDMDVTIEEALHAAHEFIKLDGHTKIPSFFNSVI